MLAGSQDRKGLWVLLWYYTAVASESARKMGARVGGYPRLIDNTMSLSISLSMH